MSATTPGTPAIPDCVWKAIPIVSSESPKILIFHAVRRMLPKNKLARQMIKKLKIYAGPEHPHIAQNPQPLARKGKKVV